MSNGPIPATVRTHVGMGLLAQVRGQAKAAPTCSRRRETGIPTVEMIPQNEERPNFAEAERLADDRVGDLCARVGAHKRSG